MRKLGLTLALLAPAFLAGCLDGSPTESSAGLAVSHRTDPLELQAPESLETATVLTRNLYLGADITPLLGAPDPVAAATAIWNQIQHTSFPSRAAHLAGEIAELRPEVIGLQEAVRFTVGPFPSAGFPEAELLDFTSVLLDQLAAVGHEYTLVVRQPNTRVAVPVPMGAGLVTIGYEDATAILVRGGVETANPTGGRFSARPPVELTAGIPFLRGWTRVDARIGGGWVRFVNTHLEIQTFAPVQHAQAVELLAMVGNSPHPVILVGDFNSAANDSAPDDRKTDTYGMIRSAGFDDLWARASGMDTGLTCCHAPDLSNGTAEFDQRLDLVFARNVPGAHGGFGGAAFVTIVGEEAQDRFEAPGGQTLWPSDHAGVAAMLRLPPGLFAVR